MSLKFPLEDGFIICAVSVAVGFRLEPCNLQRRLLMEEVKEIYNIVIQEIEVVCELIEGVCFPSFISQSFSRN